MTRNNLNEKSRQQTFHIYEADVELHPCENVGNGIAQGHRPLTANLTDGSPLIDTVDC